MWDNGGMNIKLGQAEIFDISPLSSDYSFNMEGFHSLKGIKSLFECLGDIFIKRWHTEKELEIPNIPGLRVNKYRY